MAGRKERAEGKRWRRAAERPGATKTEGTDDLGQSRVTVGDNQMGGGLLVRETVSRGVPTCPCPSFPLAQPSQSVRMGWTLTK